MEALRGFFRDERGMAPYSLIGISMLLIVGVAIYHFNNVDIQKAQERNTLTMDMETFYATVKVGQDLHQVARISTEKAILEDSMSTYENPVDVNSKWENDDKFKKWKIDLENKITGETEREIYNFYHQGDRTALAKQYYNPSTDFDFSNFIKQDGIKVDVTPDNYNKASKVQNALELNVDFKEGGTVSSTNKYTGYELAMNTSTLVSVDARPFTMADKAYEFTNTFNRQEEANQIAWRMWAIQTVLGLFEANVKRDVRYATDDRVSYSFMHLLVAYEELETFGTFDYVHTVIEFLRPWMGAEEEGAEFLSLLTLSLEGDYVDQAIASMDAAIFVSDVADSVQDISDSMIKASSHLDSSTVTKEGAGFNSSEVRDELLSGEGTVQHLERAEDTEKLTSVHDEVTKKRKKVTGAKTNVEDSTIDSLSVQAQLTPLDTEYKEVRKEWDKAKGDFTTSQNAITSARDDYSSLYSYIEGEICENPIAAMLWFEDSNQNVKGFREIISAKINETNELVEYCDGLETAIDNLSYESVADNYRIDEHYKGARDSLKDAETNMNKARADRNEYLDQKYKHDHCYRHRDWKDPEMGSCLGSGYACDSYPCNPYDCNCKTDEDGDESCDTCWDTCYHTCYDCICDLGTLKANYERAEGEYQRHMASAESHLTNAASNVSALQTQIDTFFTDKHLLEFYDLVKSAHGIYSGTTKEPLEQAVEPYSIADNYYSHWDYPPCYYDNLNRKYACAENLIQDFPASVNETNYQDMPSGPLTYDSAHEDYADYGLYYIKHVVDTMDATFGGDSVNQTTLEEGRNQLEKMKNDGVFKKILAITKTIKALVDTAGDIKSAIATIKNAEAGFPNINEHFYTTLPLPPFDMFGIGSENQGFTVVHDIRLRSDTSPGKIKIPIINKEVSLGIDSNGTRVTNPSLPIPYTPIFVYLWQFEIGPSIDSDDSQEFSTLWLIDTESSQIAPLMEMDVDDYGVSVPLYLHKPTMYKYKFTPTATISKKIGTKSLPPVFILAAGPFKTRFGPYMEPPDKGITDDPIPIDVSFDREFSNDSANLKVSVKEDGVLVRTYISEKVALHTNSVLTEDKKEFERTISTTDLELIKDYGWSEVRADTYAADISFTDLLLNNTAGEDHARVYFIDPELEAIGVKLEKDDLGLGVRVVNTGNRKVDVAINAKPVDACMFVWHGGNMSKNWIGSVGTDNPAELDVSIEAGAKISAEVLIPEKVKDKLEDDGVTLALEDEI